MPVFRHRTSRNEFFNLPDDDSAQIQFSRGVGRSASSAIVSPGPQALIDTVQGNTSTTATLTVDAAWSQLDMASAGNSGLPDNYQPVESAWYIPGPTALIDVYAPNPSTTGTLVVDGSHVIAASDTPGDNDWFAVTLTAGQTYQFGQYAYTGGLPGAEGNGVPLADAYLEIYDSAGNLLSIADGGGPNTPSGLDALMTFEAPSSGTFYVNATSYDNDGDGVGDFVGDYEIFAETAGGAYTTHYDISSPLHSIDWGGVLVNREHVSVRNPDGMEGPRPTGEAAADPATVEGNALGYPGKNVIYLYFAGEGDIYAHQDSTIPAQLVIQNPYQYEIQAMLTAANEFSKVADVVFVSNYTFNASTRLYERNENIEYKPGPLGPEAGIQYAAGVDDDFDADFYYFSYAGTPGPGISLLGSMNPPDYGDEGVAQFNSADERWNAQMLQPGGFSFVTLIHEFGHGMGLAHPHDTGGGSSIMPGVEGIINTPGGPIPDPTGIYPNYTRGDFDLNQGVFTMMSYQDGWETSPYGRAETNNEGYGWLGSLMALDIAVIQDKYGVNEDWATGNDTYVLKDENEWGVYIDAATGQPAEHNASNQATARDGYYEGQSTYYSSIWDAGGTDSIVYSGARSSNIDLRAATLRYEDGGGGWVSYAHGIYGGFTIANGVTIENATTGTGNDVLIGNDVANILDGGVGTDLLQGGRGDDSYFVDSLDTVFEYAGQGYDIVYARTSHNLAEGASVEVLGTADNFATTAINLTGNELANYVTGNAGSNTLDGGGGSDYLWGREGDDGYYADGNDVVLEYAGQGYDIVYARSNFVLGAGVHVELLGTINNFATDAFALTGNELANYVTGNAGNNVIDGGAGADSLEGRGGADTFAFTTALGGGNIDMILDFASGVDRIALDDAIFTGLGLGALSAGAFVIGTQAGDADDRIIYNSSTGALYFDADGNGAGAAIQFATLQYALPIASSDFIVI